MADASQLEALWKSLGNTGDRPVGWFGPGGSADRPNYGGASTASGLNPQSAIDEAIKRQQEAAKPAIASYQAQQPEITSKYAQTRTQLQAKEDPLKQRYQNLLASIKSQGEQDINQQTRITSGELGKRGITGSSTLAQQEIQNAVSPLRQKYTGLEKETGLAQEESLADLRNQVANLTPQETADQRAITQAIANLQAGAGQTGITQGLNIYSAQQQQQFAQDEANRQAKQQAIENALAQQQMLNQTAKTQYDISAPYFKPETASTGIGDLLALFGGGGNAPSSPKPTVYPIQQLADGRVRFSDGSIR